MLKLNRFDMLSQASQKSIDIYSAVNYDHSLMKDLRKSYPLEDMRKSLSNLPEDLALSNFD